MEKFKKKQECSRNRVAIRELEKSSKNFVFFLNKFLKLREFPKAFILFNKKKEGFFRCFLIQKKNENKAILEHF